ncbi:SAM-dependent methyltransferase [Nakamurella sp. UYEF19]|uniref:class I SAM-dependent methyltransferase n=1 Tax=Nakamurella sp. UYEF19 TaxID=1756392 RepID=UPI003392A2F1
MTARALTFGSVAAAYERYRPGYPTELVAEVLTYAGRPVRRALEIGAGTGKATRAFARRDIAVTATDPDAAMLRELAAHVPSTVTIAQAAFEDLDPGAPYDLVFAAAAMHWTEPVGRWERVAALLVPNGTFANFGGQVNLADPSVEAAVRAARAPFLESDGMPSPDGTPDESEMQWPGTELARSELFTDVRQIPFGRRATVSAHDHIGHLSTVSAYLQLTPSVRERAFDAILRALPNKVEVTSDITLHLARRAR